MAIIDGSDGDAAAPSRQPSPPPRPFLPAIADVSASGHRDFDWSSHSTPERHPSASLAARPRLARHPSLHDTATMDGLRRSLTKGPSASANGTNTPWTLTASSIPTLNSTMSSAAATGRSGDEEGAEGSDDAPCLDPYARALRRALVGACADAFGIVGADVWLRSEDEGGFDHAPGGLHASPSFRRGLPRAARVALARIEDPRRPDFVPPTRQVAGAGLAGYFWSQCGVNDRHCLWRDTRAITEDPDQPPYPRMAALVEAGFGKATGVPFDCRGHRGVVLFFAREGADQAQLAELSNDIHLRASADLIGAVSAASITSVAAAEARRARTAGTLRRVRAKLLAAIVLSEWVRERAVAAEGALEEGRGPGPHKNATTEVKKGAGNPVTPSLFRRVSADLKTKMSRTYRRSVAETIANAASCKARLWLKKARGGDVQPPPPMPAGQAVWAFAGAFLAMTILAWIKSVLRSMYGRTLPLGPFGALLTLQYGLTPAPASQPRNALYGQAASLSLALLIGLVAPTESWYRIPLTAASVIAVMCKLGITHPPAGAAAVVFASNDRLDGVSLALMLLGSLVAISVAIIVNNLNDKRQYPIYYAFVGKETKPAMLCVLERVVPCLKMRRMRRGEWMKEGLDDSSRKSYLDASMRMSRRDNRRHQKAFRH